MPINAQIKVNIDYIQIAKSRLAPESRTPNPIGLAAFLGMLGGVMQDQFVFSECTLIFVQFLRNNNVEINNPKLSDYLNNLFFEYALLTTKSEVDVSITNDLFEHTGTIKTSRTANAMKRDLNKIAELLSEAERLIHSTKGGQQLLTSDNSKVLNSIRILRASAQVKSKEIVLVGGRSQSGERSARLELVLKLRALAEYLGIATSSYQDNLFGEAIQSIYEKLRIQVSDLSRDFKEVNSQYTDARKRQLHLNFKFLEKS